MTLSPGVRLRLRQTRWEFHLRTLAYALLTAALTHCVLQLAQYVREYLPIRGLMLNEWRFDWESPPTSYCIALPAATHLKTRTMLTRELVLVLSAKSSDDTFTLRQRFRLDWFPTYENRRSIHMEPILARSDRPNTAVRWQLLAQRSLTFTDLRIMRSSPMLTRVQHKLRFKACPGGYY
jgi:hypothetical protein